MNQLKLTNKELLEIGFEESQSKGDKMNEARTYFKIKTVNGYFYYNPKEGIYTWYHKTIIGNVSNDIQLDLTRKAELFVLLACFRVKFKMVF